MRADDILMIPVGKSVIVVVKQQNTPNRLGSHGV